jgi:hypothetical protein
MNEEVKWYVQTCQKGNRFTKATRKAKCQFTNLNAYAPMERVHIEFLGPLPETNNAQYRLGQRWSMAEYKSLVTQIKCMYIPHVQVNR